MNKSLRGKVRPGRRRGLLPLPRRLTSVQKASRVERVTARAEREALKLLERAKGRRRKKES